MNKKQVKTLYVKELCNIDKYIVPIYQRNYAWGKDEIELLIQDIEEAQKTAKDKNYYIGSLVVAKRIDAYEVIDGQQRLTTLKLLLSYYNQKYQEQKDIHLTFEHREASNCSLLNLTNNSKESDNITLGYQIIHNILEQKLSGKENLDIKAFFEFLLNNVVILRTEVPEDTDLNHYFEIMNNRGEQLEKHEVLKASLMNRLEDKNERKLFALIWDACSDMNIYAIKRFPYANNDDNSIRTILFGNLCNDIPDSFTDLVDKLNAKKLLEPKGEDGCNKIISLLTRKIVEKSRAENQNEYDEIRDGTFNSIIDFPNFLMIAYKIFKNEVVDSSNENGVTLNDKYLLRDFEDLKEENKIKEFVIVLLKLRLIFDRYIIKSKDQEDSWMLNGLKKYKRKENQYYFKEVNTFGKGFSEDVKQVANDLEEFDSTAPHKKIVQLLSMFHTAFKQKIYKNWLFELLNTLNKILKSKYDLTAEDYINILEKQANEYYNNDERQLLLKKGGQAIPHYIFNYLDYLLWRDWGNEIDEKILQKDNFIFSLSRNSIEHYLPQSRKESLLGNIELDNRDRVLNSFGNLCLISHYQNSSLNDQIPSEKVKRYLSGSLKCISPKQALMMSKKPWDSVKIEEHQKEMIKILDLETSKFQ